MLQVVHEAVPVAIGASRDVGERGVLVKNIMDAEKNLKVGHTKDTLLSYATIDA